MYRLVDLPPVSNPDLVTVALRYPNAVVCLISALSFHEITTQIPHELPIAPINAFSADFISAHQPTWAAFCKRLKQDHVPESFQEIATEIELFLEPVIKGVSDDLTWNPSGSWS